MTGTLCCRLCDYDARRRHGGALKYLAIAWAGLLILVFAGLAAGAEPGAPPASVVKIDGCSGVCVDPSGVVLTAKHCKHDNRETVEFSDGRAIIARKVFESPETDGPVVLIAVDPGPYPFSPLAEAPPTVGTEVYSWGYPAGAQSHARNLSYASGIVTGGRRVPAAEVGLMPLLPAYPVNIVDGMAIDSGWSGGPLFNESGEVCGLASASNNEHSLWIPFKGVAEAYAVARVNLPETAATLRQVTYYTQPNCAPCRRFEADEAAGKFPGYDFAIGDIETTEIVGTPAFAYCGETRVGYEGGARDLLAWLTRVDRESAPPAVAETLQPEPEPTPAPGVTPWQRRPSDDIAALREQVTDLIADVKAFQDAGVLGKVGAINDLRADAAEARETAAVVQSEFAQFKADAEGKPWWWGIPAAIVGVIKRRYLNRGAVVDV